MPETRADLKTRIRLHFDNDIYYEAGDIERSIQDGYNEIIAKTGLIFRAQTIAFQPNRTWYNFRNLLTNYLGVVAIFNNVTKRFLVPISEKKLDESEYDWETRIGSPEYFMVKSYEYVGIYRKPSVSYGNMHVFYKAAAPTLSSDSDEIQILVEESPLFEYVCKDLWEMQQEFQKAGRYLKDYYTKLNTLAAAIARRTNSRIPHLRQT